MIHPSFMKVEEVGILSLKRGFQRGFPEHLLIASLIRAACRLAEMRVRRVHWGRVGIHFLPGLSPGSRIAALASSGQLNFPLRKNPFPFRCRRRSISKIGAWQNHMYGVRSNRNDGGCPTTEVNGIRSPESAVFMNPQKPYRTAAARVAPTELLKNRDCRERWDAFFRIGYYPGHRKVRESRIFVTFLGSNNFSLPQHDDEIRTEESFIQLPNNQRTARCNQLLLLGPNRSRQQEHEQYQ